MGQMYICPIGLIICFIIFKDKNTWYIEMLVVTHSCEIFTESISKRFSKMDDCGMCKLLNFYGPSGNPQLSVLPFLFNNHILAKNNANLNSPKVYREETASSLYKNVPVQIFVMR
jgi:hypothetical protein